MQGVSRCSSNRCCTDGAGERAGTDSEVLARLASTAIEGSTVTEEEGE